MKLSRKEKTGSRTELLHDAKKRGKSKIIFDQHNGEKKDGLNFIFHVQKL